MLMQGLSLVLPNKIQSCITKLSIVLSMINLLIVGLNDGQHSQVRTDIHRENDRFLIPTPHRNENEMTGGQSHHLAKDTLPTEQDKSVDKYFESADLEDFAATSSSFPDLYLFDFDISGDDPSPTLFPSSAK
jgi:hypothetical protein